MIGVAHIYYPISCPTNCHPEHGKACAHACGLDPRLLDRRERPNRRLSRGHKRTWSHVDPSQHVYTAVRRRRPVATVAL